MLNVNEEQCYVCLSKGEPSIHKICNCSYAHPGCHFAWVMVKYSIPDTLPFKQAVKDILDLRCNVCKQPYLVRSFLPEYSEEENEAEGESDQQESLLFLFFYWVLHWMNPVFIMMGICILVTTSHVWLAAFISNLSYICHCFFLESSVEVWPRCALETRIMKLSILLNLVLWILSIVLLNETKTVGSAFIFILSGSRLWSLLHLAQGL